MKKILSRTFGFVSSLFLVGMFLSGCATVPKGSEATPQAEGGVSEKPPLTSAEKEKQNQAKIDELRLRIKSYEAKGEFRKALQAWKRIQALSPADSEARRMVSQLENGLKMAIEEHLRLGVAALQRGEIERSRKELLLVLFLDSGQREALEHLRQISLFETSPHLIQARKGILPADRAGKEGEYTLHTIKEGESLSIVAEKYYGDKMKFQVLAEFNGISDVAKIRVGQTIKVPMGGKTDPPVKTVDPPVVVAKEEPKLREEIKPEEPKKILPKPEQPSPKASAAALDQRVKQGKKFYQENRFAEAVAEFQEIVRAQPEHREAIDYMNRSHAITASLKKGTSLYDAKEYESAYEEFNKILLLKPDVAPAKDRVENLVPLLTAKARYLLREEQSPCETIALAKKILQGAPNHKEVQKLLDEAIELEKGLELQC